MTNLIYCAQHDQTKSDWKENIKLNDIETYNKKKYGIFVTVNSFLGKRKKDCLDKLLYWAIDIDQRDKEWQAKRILDIGIEPSKIIESSRGYHIYWKINGNTTIANWEFMVGKMLIPLFEADAGAKDVTRVLRLPNCYHWKDINNPFLIKKIYYSLAKYDETTMFNLLFKKCTEYNIKLKEEIVFKNIINKTNKITAHELAYALNAKKCGHNSYICLCPIHNETKPSFRITQAGDKVLVKCFGPCSQQDIISGLIRRNLWR